jgi:hypothetical protein
MDRNKTTYNIVLGIVGLTIVSSILVLLLGICATVRLSYFECHTIVNT